MIDNGGNGHHAIPPYLKSLGVETLILGNRGQGAIEAIAASGLKEMPGITGSADEAAELLQKKSYIDLHHATPMMKTIAELRENFNSYSPNFLIKSS